MPLSKKKNANNKFLLIFSLFLHQSHKWIFQQKNSENKSSGKNQKSHMPEFSVRVSKNKLFQGLVSHELTARFSVFNLFFNSINYGHIIKGM